MNESNAMFRSSHILTLVAILTLSGLTPSFALGQQTTPRKTPQASEATADAARRMVLESDRWKRAYKSFNDWLAVQQAYTPEQVEEITTEMRGRIATMSAEELKQFLKEMETRLEVLKSPEAADARDWLQQFFAVAKNPEKQLGRQRPDVLNMTAEQIRQEIDWVQDTRDRRQRSQAAFESARAAQGRVAADMRDQRRQGTQASPPNRTNWPANQPPSRSPYAPRRERQPLPPSPVHSVSPWGVPVFRYPHANWW